MISTSELHLLGSHFEQYPDYQPRNFKSNASKDNQEPESGNLGVFHFPVLSFGFIFVLLGITCEYLPIHPSNFQFPTTITTTEEVQHDLYTEVLTK